MSDSSGLSNAADYTNAADHQRKFTYRTAKRAEKQALDQIGVGQWGHMVETLADAAMIIQQLAKNPTIDVMKNPSAERYDTGSPSYVNDFARDIRLAPTFFHTDQPLPRLKAEEKTHLTLLLDKLHGQLRQLGKTMGEAVVMPEELASLKEAYDVSIQNYADLVARYREAPPADTSFKATNEYFRKIPARELASCVEAYQGAATALFSAMRALPDVKWGAHALDNKAILNPALPDSYPALAFFAMKAFSRMGADFNQKPAAEYPYFLNMIGTESLITDTMQIVIDKTGDKTLCAVDYPKMEKILKEHGRDLQLTQAFCRTAGCGYAKMYEDMELFSRMAGVKAKLSKLETPQEAALMFYAVDRRFAREGQEPALQKQLRAYADRIAGYADKDALAEDFGQNSEFRWMLEKCIKAAERHGLNHVRDAVKLVQDFVPYAYSAVDRVQQTPSWQHSRN